MAREEWEEDFFRAAEEVQERTAAARRAGIHYDTLRYHLRRDKTFAARVASELGDPKFGPPRRPHD